MYYTIKQMAEMFDVTEHTSEENLRARYAIILKQRDAAYHRLEEAKL